MWKILATTVVMMSAATLSMSQGLGQSAGQCMGIGGALPADGRCPREAGIEWWNGAWATREVDEGGRKLTAFTMLKPDYTYRTTLDYDDGSKVEHWGRYKVIIDEGPVEEEVDSFVTQAEDIEVGLTAGVLRGTANIGGALPAPLPSDQRRKITCFKGRIEYLVEGRRPKLSFPSPQVFEFRTLGDGYVYVRGPGANDVLARRYK